MQYGDVETSNLYSYFHGDAYPESNTYADSHADTESDWSSLLY